MLRLHRYLQETVGLGLGGQVEKHGAAYVLRIRGARGAWFRLVLAEDPEPALPLEV